MYVDVKTQSVGNTMGALSLLLKFVYIGVSRQNHQYEPSEVDIEEEESDEEEEEEEEEESCEESEDEVIIR